MASYPYAAGVVRSLEKRLLNKTDIERMVDAPDLESAFKVFFDTDYADNLADVKPHEYKKALDEDFKQARALILSTVDDENLRNFLFIKNDFRNIKLFFKADQNSQDLQNYKRDFGLADMENLYKYIIDNDKNASIPELLRQVIDQAKNDLDDKDNDPYEIDAYFDEIYFNIIKKAVAEINNKFITGLFTVQYKSNNLKFFIRAKRLNKTFDEIKKYLPEDYKNSYDQPIEEVLKKMAWPIEMENAVNDYLADANLWKLEKNIEEAEIEYLRRAKLIGYGPELVVAYYFAKRNAIRNVRLIMTGKINNVSTEKIKQRIREIY